MKISLKQTTVLLIAIYVICALLKNIFNVEIISEIWAGVAILYLFGISVKHASTKYGSKSTLVFFLITAVVSWSIESLSIKTGFPFGHYNYTDALSATILGIPLKIGQVPLIIMPSYFAMGYLAWSLSHVFLNRYNSNYSSTDFLLIPFVASFIMVSWDLTFDPLSSTVTNLWNWHDGGFYFGVPIQNFAGWFLCVYIIYFLFFFYIKNKPVNRKISKTKSFWTYPALAYLFFSVDTITRPIRAIRGFDANEKVPKIPEFLSESKSPVQQWFTYDIYYSLALISVFTMVSISIFALILVARNNQLSKR
jgi:putative membrane protein